MSKSTPAAIIRENFNAWALTITGGTLPQGLTLSYAGLLSGAAQTVGTTNLVVTATDSLGFASSTSVPLTVKVNEAPVLNAIGARTVTAGNLLTFTAAAQDPDGGSLSFSLAAGAPAGAAIDTATGVFTWTPTEAQVGTFAVTVRVTDNGSPALSDSETIDLTVNASTTPNRPPVLDAIGARMVTAGNPLTFTAQAQDPDGGSLSFSLAAGAPAGATIDAVTGVFTWTPTEAQIGTFTITAHVTDNGSLALSDSETFSVTVNSAIPVTPTPTPTPTPTFTPTPTPTPTPEPTPPPPQVTVTLTVPRVLRARGLLISLRTVSLGLRNVPRGATVTVTVLTTTGRLRLVTRGLRIRGNNTGRLILTGNHATVSRALRGIQLTLARRGARGRVTLLAAFGRVGRRATIQIA